MYDESGLITPFSIYFELITLCLTGMINDKSSGNYDFFYPEKRTGILPNLFKEGKGEGRGRNL